MSAAVDVRDAFRIFASPAGGTAALQGLTLQVEQGEVVVALGPSGCGKTTLLRTVAGLERLSAGSARVLGTELVRTGRRARAAFRAERLGLLDQHYARSLSPDLSCRDTVALQLRLLGRDARESRRAADELLERVGLEGRGDARPAELSGRRAAARRGLRRARPPARAAARGRARRRARRGHGRRRCTACSASSCASAAARRSSSATTRPRRRSPTAACGCATAASSRRRTPAARARSSRRAAGSGCRARAETGAVTPAEAAGLPRRTGPRPRRPSARRRAAAAGPPAAELAGVEKSYGDRVVLAGVTAAFFPGRLTAVVGRSGSGKTTLLHLLAGLERPTAGAVAVAGRPLGGLTRAELAALRGRHVALVTQEPGLVPYLSALENVELGLARARLGARRRARGPRAPSGSRSVCATRSNGSRPASASGSRSPARSPPTSTCSSSTSRPPASTRRARAPSARCSRAWRASGPAWRSSAPRTTRCSSSSPRTC